MRRQLAGRGSPCVRVNALPYQSRTLYHLHLSVALSERSELNTRHRSSRKESLSWQHRLWQEGGMAMILILLKLSLRFRPLLWIAFYYILLHLETPSSTATHVVRCSPYLDFILLYIVTPKNAFIYCYPCNKRFSLSSI
jgi:hypothetical protein